MLLFLGLGTACLGQSSPASNSLYIDDVTVIDATGTPPQPHRSVIVRDGRIVEIVPREEGVKADKPAGTRIDGRGKFLIPGLWDMHVHMIFGDWFPRGKEVTLPLFIANGITGGRATWAASWRCCSSGARRSQRER